MEKASYERMFDLKQKEVVNVIDGTRLGFLVDLEVDLENGALTGIIVPGPRKFLGLFGRDFEYQIPWSSIKKIGEDIILVEVDLEQCLHEVYY